MIKHQVSTSYKGNMAFAAEIDHHNVLMDASVNDGGDDAAPSPKKLMLASLAGCTGIDIVSILSKMKVSFSQFDIMIEATLTDDYPKIYNHVSITYSIKVKEQDKPKMEKAVQLSQEKYCGVNAMFKAFATVIFAIKYIS
jgi:putative redox protein